MLSSPATVDVGHRVGRRADDLARYAVLALSLAVGVLTLVVDALAVPVGTWSALLLAWFAATTLAISRRTLGRGARLLLYGCALLVSWVLLLTVATSGTTVVVLLVAMAATGSHLLPMPWVLGVVAANCAVVVGHAWWAGAEPVDAVASAVFYLIVHLAVVLTGYAMSRESGLRAELERTNVELEAAGVLLEDSAAAAERLRISRDLHDAIGHQLTVLTLELTAAEHRLGASEVPPREHAAVREHVRRAGGVAKELLADVRRTVGELRAPGPADLRRDLERLARAVPSLEIHVDVEDGVATDADAAATLVRAAQEIITNTIRHAGAAELALTVRRDGDAVVLTGSNDGATPERITPGHGLTGLRERLALLGGGLALTTAPQFTVEARVPASAGGRPAR